MDINDFFNNSAELFNNKSQREDGIYKEKLNLKVGNEYVVRLLPYLKEGKEGWSKSVFKFWQYAWQSVLDGRWQYVLSPKTWGERCPITEFYFKAKNSKDENQQAKVKGLSYKEGCYYNVYVVDDPVNPANNGTVKILQASKQLNAVIMDALSQDPKIKEKYREELDIEDMHRAIFDLSEKGVNLCIDVQDQGGFANYKSSRFIRRKRDLGLSNSEIDEIHQQTFDLTKINRVLSVSEVEDIFCKTFLGMRENTKKSTSSFASNETSSTDIKQVTPSENFFDDDIPSFNGGDAQTLSLDEVENILLNS